MIYNHTLSCINANWLLVRNAHPNYVQPGSAESKQIQGKLAQIAAQRQSLRGEIAKRQAARTKPTGGPVASVASAPKKVGPSKMPKPTGFPTKGPSLGHKMGGSVRLAGRYSGLRPGERPISQFGKKW